MFVCVFFFCSCSPPPPSTHTPTHPLTPPSRRWLVATATVSPLFLMLLWDSDRQTWAEWQCVCGSGKRPKTTNKRRSRQTLPQSGVWGPQVDCLGWQEPPQPFEEEFISTFFISSSFVSVRKCASHCLLNDYEGDKNIAQVKKDPCYTKGDSDNIHIYNSYIYINNGSMNMSNLKSASSSDKPTPPVDIKSCCKVTRTQQKR